MYFIASRVLRRKELERYAKFTSLVSGALVGLFGFSYILYHKMRINATEGEVLC